MSQDRTRRGSFISFSGHPKDVAGCEPALPAGEGENSVPDSIGADGGPAPGTPGGPGAICVDVN